MLQLIIQGLFQRRFIQVLKTHRDSGNHFVGQGRLIDQVEELAFRLDSLHGLDRPIYQQILVIQIEFRRKIQGKGHIAILQMLPHLLFGAGDDIVFPALMNLLNDLLCEDRFRIIDDADFLLINT